MSHARRLALGIGLLACASSAARAEGEPPQYCIGEYAEDLQSLAPKVRELEHQPYSFCVRNTVVYECLSYAADGSVRRTRRQAVAHGTAFAYRQEAATGTTLLFTNEHVAEWPAVTPDGKTADGVPAGCKRVSENLRIVDNEQDDYEADDVSLTRIVADPQLDAAVLRAKATLPVLPWKIGHSAALHERDAVEVRGFPLGAFAATNVGKVVSAFQHDDEGQWDHDDFVVDALLSNGNSGSPVLAVSCKTGELELVGVYHAGYLQGSALNVVVGIDQLRDMMTTLKRTPRAHGEPNATLDEVSRATLARQVVATPWNEPFYPFGPFTAAVRPRGDGALVFEVFGRDFPFHTTPLFAFEDLAKPAAFGDVGRMWFGGRGGIKSYSRSDLDADAQAAVMHTIEALRRDGVAFFANRSGATTPPKTRAEFEKAERAERSLSRTVAGRRELASSLADVADRLAPRPPEPTVALGELFTPLPPPSLATLPPARSSLPRSPLPRSPLPAPHSSAPPPTASPPK
ncbi:MAG TPA: serine protease [Polyangia bacterium]|nr:serine protease [Polyangia bacterium]